MPRIRHLALAAVLGLLAASPALADVLEGTVTLVGKDRFSVKAERPAAKDKKDVSFKASPDLLKGKFPPRELHRGRFEDLKVGQRVSVKYHADEKTGQLVADGYYVLKPKKP